MLRPEILQRQPRWLLVLEALTLLAVIGLIDYRTGWEWSLFAPYALPIVIATWGIGFRTGIVFSFLCAFTYMASDLGSNPYHTSYGFAIAVISRWFYFMILVVALAALKSRRELDRQRIQSLEQLCELERQILQTSEREQQRIGRDLHDGLGPHLAAIGYAANCLASELQQRNSCEAAQAQEICTLARDAVSNARDLAHGLFPTHLDGLGLSIALAELARNASAQTGLPVSFYGMGEPKVADSETGIHLYRIAQESLSNAVKHSGAAKITIALNMASSGALRLTVADDGKGMKLPIRGSRGMGLHSMNYRANSLRGKLKIDSKPGEGTIVSCEILAQPLLSTSLSV